MTPRPPDPLPRPKRFMQFASCNLGALLRQAAAERASLQNFAQLPIQYVAQTATRAEVLTSDGVQHPHQALAREGRRGAQNERSPAKKKMAPSKNGPFVPAVLLCGVLEVGRSCFDWRSKHPTSTGQVLLCLSPLLVSGRSNRARRATLRRVGSTGKAAVVEMLTIQSTMIARSIQFQICLPIARLNCVVQGVMWCVRLLFACCSSFLASCFCFWGGIKEQICAKWCGIV